MCAQSTSVWCVCRPIYDTSTKKHSSCFLINDMPPYPLYIPRTIQYICCGYIFILLWDNKIHRIRIGLGLNIYIFTSIYRLVWRSMKQRVFRIHIFALYILPIVYIVRGYDTYMHIVLRHSILILNVSEFSCFHYI